MNRGKAQTRAFTKYFAFFAFNKKQLDENVNQNFRYANLGSGLICPTIFVDKLVKRLEEINDAVVKDIKASKSTKEIILDALANYEVQFTGDLTDVIDSLADYGISTSEIKEVYKEYYQYCCDNDLF